MPRPQLVRLRSFIRAIAVGADATALSTTLFERIKALREVLTREAEADTANGNDMLRFARGLSATAPIFADDGPERAADLMQGCEEALAAEEKSLLKNAIQWRAPEARLF